MNMWVYSTKVNIHNETKGWRYLYRRIYRANTSHKELRVSEAAGQEWVGLRAGVSPRFSIGLYYSILKLKCQPTYLEFILPWIINVSITIIKIYESKYKSSSGAPVIYIGDDELEIDKSADLLGVMLDNGICWAEQLV